MSGYSRHSPPDRGWAQTGSINYPPSSCSCFWWRGRLKVFRTFLSSPGALANCFDELLLLRCAVNITTLACHHGTEDRRSAIRAAEKDSERETMVQASSQKKVRREYETERVTDGGNMKLKGEEIKQSGSIYIATCWKIRPLSYSLRPPSWLGRGPPDVQRRCSRPRMCLRGSYELRRVRRIKRGQQRCRRQPLALV